MKLRGILVGTVRKISTYNVPATAGRQPETRARVTLALEPAKAKLIPVGATALLLPKTLFGERYVALQVPADLPAAEARPVRSGDTISGGRDAIEVERVLDDLYPVLLALHPEDLKATLTALATALQGRGKQLGDNLAAFNDYLLKFNPKVPTLADDLAKLGQVATVYNDAAPDLLATLGNLQTTSRTITSRPQALDQLLTVGHLDVERAGRLPDRRRRLPDPAVGVLGEGAQGAGRLLPGVPVPGPGAGRPGTPAGGRLRRQAARPAHHAGVHQRPRQVRARQRAPAGLGRPALLRPAQPAQAVPGRRTSPTARPRPARTSPLPSADRAAYHAGGVGSPAESRLISGLLSGDYGNDPAKVPALATLLAGPLLRGSEVTVG